MGEVTVRCPQCGREGIVITELLNSDLALISDHQQAEIERLQRQCDQLTELVDYERGVRNDGRKVVSNTCEQKARDLLQRLSDATYYTDPQRLSAGDVVELAQLFAEIKRLKLELEELNDH